MDGSGLTDEPVFSDLPETQTTFPNQRDVAPEPTRRDEFEYVRDPNFVRDTDYMGMEGSFETYYDEEDESPAASNINLASREDRVRRDIY